MTTLGYLIWIAAGIAWAIGGFQPWGWWLIAVFAVLVIITSVRIVAHARLDKLEARVKALEETEPNDDDPEQMIVVGEPRPIEAEVIELKTRRRM